jgi:trehalose 6-phosphate phosphatase
MKDILHPAQRDVLARFAATNTLAAFDFDGTLAPITKLPDRAQMRPVTSSRLEELASLYPCVVISGRSRCDVRARLGSASLLEVIGNHGAEPGPEAAERDATLDAVRAWFMTLEALTWEVPGIAVEYKRYSLAIHYRGAPHKGRARSAIASAVAALQGARVIGGKQVVNIVPAAAPDKGVALERVRARLACDTALYVGDDETDEDVFALGPPDRILSVRVGARGASRAAYCIRDQLQIDALLEVLIELRRKGAT